MTWWNRGSASGWSGRYSRDSSMSGSGWNDYNSMFSSSYENAASQVVQRLFDDIDVLLFEREASASLSKTSQTECLNWSSRFLHLRAIGSQLAPELDETGPAVQSGENDHSDSATTLDIDAQVSSLKDELEGLGLERGSTASSKDLCVTGVKCPIHNLDSDSIPTDYEINRVLNDESNVPVPPGLYWESYEEIFASDGCAEEYYVLDNGSNNKNKDSSKEAHAAELKDTKDQALSVITNQVFEDVWELAIPVLLPAVEQAIEEMTREPTSSLSPSSSFEDIGGEMMHPLNQGSLAYLPTDRNSSILYRDDAIARVRSAKSAVQEKIHTPREQEGVNSIRPSSKLRELSNAMTIKGLPLQARQSQFLSRVGLGGQRDRGLDYAAPTGAVGVGDGRHDINGPPSELPGRRDVGTASNLNVLNSNRIDDSIALRRPLGSARIGSARVAARPKTVQMMYQPPPRTPPRTSLYISGRPPSAEKKYATLISQVFTGPDLNLVDPRWPHREPKSQQDLSSKMSRQVLDGEALPRIGLTGRPDSAVRPTLPSLSRRRVLSATVGRKPPTMAPVVPPRPYTKLEMPAPIQPPPGMPQRIQLVASKDDFGSLRPNSVHSSRYESLHSRLARVHP